MFQMGAGTVKKTKVVLEKTTKKNEYKNGKKMVRSLEGVKVQFRTGPPEIRDALLAPPPSAPIKQKRKFEEGGRNALSQQTL